MADNGASDKHTRGECGLRYKLRVVGWSKTTAGQGGKSRKFVLFENRSSTVLGSPVGALSLRAHWRGDAGSRPAAMGEILLPRLSGRFAIAEPH